MFDKSCPWDNCFNTHKGKTYTRDEWHEHVKINGWPLSYLLKAAKSPGCSSGSFHDPRNMLSIYVDTDEVIISPVFSDAKGKKQKEIKTTVLKSEDKTKCKSFKIDAHQVKIRPEKDDDRTMEIYLDCGTMEMTVDEFAPDIDVKVFVQEDDSLFCGIVLRSAKRAYEYDFEKGVDLFSAAVEHDDLYDYGKPERIGW